VSGGNGSAASITTNVGGPASNGSLNIAAGDKVVCPFRASTGSSITISNTGGDTPTYTTVENDGTVGFTVAAIFQNMAAQSADFFTGASSGAVGVEIICQQFTGGLLTGIIDTPALLQGGHASATSVTSGTFNTATSVEAIIFFDAINFSRTYTVGLIGSATAGNLVTAPLNVDAVENTITSSPQSSITAAISLSGTAAHNWQLVAIK
jgi:hypothetical protein